MGHRMVEHTLLKSKHQHRCQRCGGQILRFYDEAACLQCGAPYTKDGELTTQVYGGKGGLPVKQETEECRSK